MQYYAIECVPTLDARGSWKVRLFRGDQLNATMGSYVLDVGTTTNLPGAIDRCRVAMVDDLIQAYRQQPT